MCRLLRAHGQVMSDGGRLELEGGVCSTAEAGLRARGHSTARRANLGGYQAIERRRLRPSGEGGGSAGFVYAGASEMRKDGHAAGY